MFKEKVCSALASTTIEILLFGSQTRKLVPMSQGKEYTEENTGIMFLF